MQAADVHDHAPSGLSAFPRLRWGSHVGHFFQPGEDVGRLLASYFKAGLDNNERCLWVTGEPLTPALARAALAAVVPDLERRESAGQIEILDGAAFYDTNKPLPIEELLSGLLQREEEALEAGFVGLRTNGNCAWVGEAQWADFRRYEARVQDEVRTRRMICMCSYRPSSMGGEQLVDVMGHHTLVLPPGGEATAQPSAVARAAEIVRLAEATSAGLPALEAWLELDQGVLDALPLGFYCCDADGQIVRANRRACELWGRPVRRLSARHRFCGAFRLETMAGQPIPPDESPMARAVVDGVAAHGVEARVQNPDGRRWVARVDVEPLRAPDGRVVGAINCFQDVTREYEMRLTLERQQRTFDLAMVASNMGTWRYSLSDNICVYDENAQRLYGLTEAAFLHDEEGVKQKFHPEDMELMWSRVAQALNPSGDGRYDVEYRVRQLDGSWRWLSAWGAVEFEDEAGGRRAVAISGASRDLTESKRAEELQRLLLNELNHRVKNTLATVQSIASYTLRRADDLKQGRDALNERILSLSRAHDLLTRENWVGADLRDVVQRALEPFPATQIEVSGPSADLAPGPVLALSMAIHELATNAAKYGALSVGDGRVSVGWTVLENRVVLQWQETGGPLVSAPSRQGFGSRLLEHSLARDLGGASKLEFAPAGVRCELVMAL